jgi:hypothetical protein
MDHIVKSEKEMKELKNIKAGDIVHTKNVKYKIIKNPNKEELIDGGKFIDLPEGKL